MAVVLLLGTVPVAEATEAPPCSDVTDDAAIPVQDRYYRVDGGDREIEVWEETNGVDGLQRIACTTSDGETHPADTHQDAVSPIPDLGGVIGFIIELCNDLYGGPNDYCF